MALGVQTGQAQKQQQKQAMTPAMWLGLNLLTLPVTELSAAVKKELDSNPALERAHTLTGRSSGAGAVADYLENVAADSRVGLEEHLMSELRMSGITPREEELCRAIIADLDDDGRFTGSLPDLVMVTRASEQELEAARQRVMTIDPKGCGARNLEECLLAQIGRVPAAKREMFRREVANIRSGKVAPEAVAILKKLEPFPGRLYDRRKTEYVVPDVRVDADGTVEVDQRDIPELQVSPKYVEMAKDKSLDEETRQYAAERVRRAREFREAVVRRMETVEKIAEFAIEGQNEFLSKGAGSLRRQTMSEVAKKAKCNVATVSRAAARKFVKTPRGTIPLRSFFALVDAGPVEKLRELLNTLPKGKPISDREISERLAEQGVKMARRTVAKYRSRFEKNK